MVCEKLSTYWPPALVIVVISFEYAVFLIHNLLPQYNRATGLVLPDKDDANNYVPSKTEIYGILVSFHFFFLLTWICFYRSARTDPGHIPRTDVWINGEFGVEDNKENKLRSIYTDITGVGDKVAYVYQDEKLLAERDFLKTFPVVERKLDLKKDEKGEYQMKLRHCKNCSLYKPDRTHHCAICKRCVLRMDHHCPWLANCVGYHNYKYFLLFLFYGATCCAYVVIAMFRRMLRCFRPVLDVNRFFYTDLLIILAWAFALFLCIALFSFFVFHLGLVVNCLTTIEFREKQSSTSQLVQHRWLVAHQKFDQGSKRANIEHVFGSWWMWLFPIASNKASVDGTYFSTPDDHEHHQHGGYDQLDKSAPAVPDV